METVACNLCGGEDFQTLYQLPDLHFQLSKERFTYIRCKQCGLVFQNPRLTSDEISEFYPDEYECYQSIDANKQTSWLLTQLIKFGFQKRWNTILRFKPGGKILDVGCATGNFLYYMQNHDQWSLRGLEINATAAQIARNRGLNVSQGTLDQTPLPEGEFDVVTMWDVLEHLHDPGAALKQVKRILNPGGIVVIRVPNLGSWDYALFKDRWHGFEPPRHLYIFNVTTLSKTLAHAGLQVIQKSSEYGSFMNFVLDIRFWLTAKGYPADKIQRISRILYHPISRAIFSPLFFLLGLGLHGPSITLVARNNEI